MPRCQVAAWVEWIIIRRAQILQARDSCSRALLDYSLIHAAHVLLSRSPSKGIH